MRFTFGKMFRPTRNFFGIEFGVRQGLVLSPILFALYIDDISDCNSIVLYADDILLTAPSVVELERLYTIVL